VTIILAVAGIVAYMLAPRHEITSEAAASGLGVPRSPTE
jgi:hypothetical protein